ncbi:putative ribonuclease H-like domain-containing protein [Tanacetum coccineum]|uniref:Ribonuclease H-like domain-containing protein n=1 Tax=Tanacetum coccineum TaxID=301880 RepID=A0ABQ5AQG5_9ASTR
MRMEQYLTHTDYGLWEVIQNGNGPISTTTDANGVITEVPPKTAQGLLARQRERKDKSTLLLALPDEHQLKFHGIDDAKELWAAIKNRFEGLDKAYDRFQRLISQLEVHGAPVSNEDANHKFLKALPSAWSNIALIMRNNENLDTLDLDDLYNNLKVYEVEIKGSSGSSSNSQNIAFLSSKNASSSDEALNTTNDASITTSYNFQGQSSSSSYADEVMFKKVNGYHAVPPPLTGNYIPLKADLSFAGLDDSVYKCNVSKTIVNESKVETNITKTSTNSVENPKTVRPSAPIIEEWESNSDDECEIRQSKPSYTKISFVKSDEYVKTPREPIKQKENVEQNKYRQAENSRKSQNRMAKKSVIKNNVGQGAGQRETRPVWNNAQRIYHQNKFVPLVVLTRSGRITVSTAKKSSPRAAVSTSPTRPVNTATPKKNVNVLNSRRNSFHKSHSPIRRSFYRSTTPKTRNSNEKVNIVWVKKVNTAGQKAVSAIEGNGNTAVKASTETRPTLRLSRELDGGGCMHLEEVQAVGSKTGKGVGPEWVFDIDSLTMSMNYKPFTAGNQTNGNIGSKDAEKELTEEPANELLLSVSSFVNTATPQDAYSLPDDPNMPPLENIVYSKEDENACIFGGAYDDQDMGAEADINNLESTMTVSPIPITRVHKDHPVNQIIRDLYTTPQTRRMTKQSGEQALIEPKKVIQALTDPSWIEAMQEELLNKKDERGLVVKNKARLAAQGYTQEEGIDYNEVFAPVARIEEIRLFLAYASYMGFVVYQMDVKSAFLYGTIEQEVYVCQPSGFEDPQFPNKVYKVEKALYGLHQALKACEFEEMMHKKFQMSSMEELTFFLGLQVKQKDEGIFISQDKYVADILKKFDFATVKTSSTLLEPSKSLLKDEEANDVDFHLYRSMIGSLMYLTTSRPDIMFVVCNCARFQVLLKTSHLYAVKRIFRYLKGQPKSGLWYPRDFSFELEAFTNSDYASSSLDRKSTTGGCQFLGKRLISCCIGLLNLVEDQRENEENADFHQILDFLTSTLINFALAVSPTIYASYVEQFWNTACLKSINSEKQIHANVDGKAVVVSESSVRRDLRLNDEDGTACLTNAEFFENLALMGYEPVTDKLTFYKVVVGEGSEQPLESQPTPSTASPEVHTQVATVDVSQPPKDPKTYRRTKRGRNTEIAQSGGSPSKVSDDTVHKEWGHSVVRDATTSSSLEAQQIRYEGILNLSNDPPLLGVNTPRSGKDSGMDIKEMDKIKAKTNVNPWSTHKNTKPSKSQISP